MTQKKRKIKNWIYAAVAVLVIAGLTILPFAIENAQSGSKDITYLSGTVEAGTVSTVLSGTGTLTEQEGVVVSVPQGVEVTGFLVKNGDTVSKGDPVATVNRTTVLQTISTVQENLDYLAGEIDDVLDETVSTSVKASVGGRVMAVYASAGDSVQEVILEHGALASISLDGLVAVTVENGSSVRAGATVTVRTEDGTDYTGMVEKNLDGQVTVTFTDNGPVPGTTATVLDGEGRTIGSGEIFIHSEWKVIGTNGIVTGVKVSAGKTVSSGTVLFTLKETGSTARYETLAETRRDYEDTMLKLFLMYKDGTVSAPADGVVTGVDTGIVKTANSGSGFKITLLSNAPDGYSDSATNMVGVIKEVNGSSYTVLFGSTVYSDVDYENIQVSPETLNNEQTVSGVSFFRYSDGSWSVCSASVGDEFLFTSNGGGGFAVYLGHVNVPGGEGTNPGGEETNPGGEETNPGGEGTNPGGEGTNPGGEEPNPGGQGGNPGGEGGTSGGFPGGGISFGGFSGGSAAAAETFSLYDLEETALMTVVPTDTVSVTITVDELDILKIHVGDSATVTVDALPGRHYTATVTELNTVASSGGGNSKYSAVVTMERESNMLGGMNTSVKITVAEYKGVLTVPAAALEETAEGTVVYTAYDTGSKALANPVTVTTGVSDGTNVEILSGLSEGDSYWYAELNAPDLGLR